MRSCIVTALIGLICLASTVHAAPPPDIAQMIGQEQAYNDVCGGGSGDSSVTQSACQRRDKLFHDLNTRGWCWGPENQVEANKRWQPCQSGPMQAPAASFYWCEPLKVYFPYVRDCPVPWREVPHSAVYPTQSLSPASTPQASSGPIAIAPLPAPTSKPAAPPPPATSIQQYRSEGSFVVTMQASASNGGRPVITGKTNLPDGAHLAVWLSRPWLPNGRERLAVNLPACGDTCLPLAATPGLLADDVLVKNGEFRDGPISDNGANLKPGTYVLEIALQFASLQPPEVRAIIGDLGENMMGPLVGACCFAGHQSQMEIQKELSDLRASAPVLGASIYYARQIEIAP